MQTLKHKYEKEQTLNRTIPKRTILRKGNSENEKLANVYSEKDNHEKDSFLKDNSRKGQF